MKIEIVSSARLNHLINLIRKKENQGIKTMYITLENYEELKKCLTVLEIYTNFKWYSTGKNPTDYSPMGTPYLALDLKGEYLLYGSSRRVLKKKNEIIINFKDIERLTQRL